MRFIDTAIPLLAGLSTLVEAQNVDFGKVYSVRPQLKSASNTETSTSLVKTSSIASSIVSVLSSRHAATMISSASTASSSTKTSSSVKSSAALSSKPSSATTLSTKKTTSSTKQSSSSTQKTSSSAAASSSPCINKDVTDAKGKVYTIKCNSDTNVGAFTNKPATKSFADCMTACDETSGCVAFTYVGGDGGSSAGTCWLKSSAGSAVAAGTNYVAGFLKSTASSSQTMTTSTKKSSSSSAKISTSTKKVTSISSKASTSTSTRKTSSTKVKRATATTCSNPNNILYNYAPNPNTPTQFLVDTTLAGLAAAQWYPPAGYSTSFTTQLAGLFAPNYLGYQQLSSYDTKACSGLCNARSDCNAFNIYFQRTPTFIPDDSCPNPTAGTSITCALYGSAVNASQASNIGQYRNDFMVVIQGSNSYNLNPVPASVSSFQGPTALDAVAYSSNIYLSQGYFSTYDVSQCSSLCTTYTANNKTQNAKSSTYTPCNYFNVFNLTLNGQTQMMGCYLFSTSNASSYDTYRTAQDPSGTTYNLTNSYGYALYPQDKGLTSVTWTPAPTGKNATCSALGKAGSSLIDYNGVNYTLGCGYDVQYAADIGNQTTPDFYSCFAICDSGSYPGCNGFAYLGNTCYFKNLAGTSRTPQLNNYNVDMAWMPSSYAGFNAYTVAGTVSYTTTTTVWAGPGSTTTTTVNGLSGTVIVKTSGSVPAATTTTYVTVITDSGTASTIATQTITPTKGLTGTISIVYPTPATTCTNKGAAVGFYSNSVTGTAFKPEVMKTSTPFAQATGISYIGEYGGIFGAYVYGNYELPTTLATLALNHVFYVFAGHGTGYYYINLPEVDNVALLWVGPNALSGYTRANAQLIQTSSASAPATLGFFLTANTYTPIRLWYANGGSQGGFQFTITAPDGATILQTTPYSNAGVMNADIVMFPCISSQGAKFPAFGKET
ncbi:hypothetical protein KCU78_g1652, partial [Aureobasidium melanogenum]